MLVTSRGMTPRHQTSGKVLIIYKHRKEMRRAIDSEYFYKRFSALFFLTHELLYYCSTFDNQL